MGRVLYCYPCHVKCLLQSCGGHYGPTSFNENDKVYITPQHCEIFNVTLPSYFGWNKIEEETYGFHYGAAMANMLGLFIYLPRGFASSKLEHPNANFAPI